MADEPNESEVAAAPEKDGATETDLAEEEDDLLKLQEEIRKMEEEAARIAKQTEELNSQHNKKNESSASSAGGASAGAASASANGDSGTAAAGGATKRDGFSVYVGQVDYSATPEELLAHFEPCGVVERVTIVCDKFTGRPKGFAYLEFQTEEAMENAVKFDGSTFKDRQLKVTHKRVNDPNFYRGGG